MSQKSRRGGSQSQQQTPVSSSSTDYPSSSSQSIGQSPITPTRMSRIQEKNQLINLNDRLAAYIDKNQQLEQENAQLTILNQKYDETLTRNINRVTQTYEKELIDARRMIDETAKSSAKLQFDKTQLKKDLDESKNKLDKKVKEEAALLKKNSSIENQLDQLGRQLKTVQDERNKLATAIKDLESEVGRLAKENDEGRKKIEVEVLHRVDLENQLKTKTEEFNFKSQVHEQEVVEIRMQKQVELQAVDERVQQDYEAKLQESIQELRNEFEAQVNANKDEMERLYEQKVADLKQQLKRVQTSASSKTEEAASLSSRIDGLTTTVTKLEAERNDFLQRVKDLEKKLSDDHNKFAKMLDVRDNEIEGLMLEKEAMMNDYHQLMDTKVALANEIATYRKLLEGEERRLSLSPKQLARGGTPGGRETPLRATKRKRAGLLEYDTSYEYDCNSTAQGDVEILEDDPEGKFVRLHNKGDKEVSISGWALVRKANDQETKHKFHRQMKLDADGTVVIWSSDIQGSVHEPPASIILKGQKWYAGDLVVTTLSNTAGEITAERTTKRTQISHQRKRFGLSPEELFHQEPDAQADRCTIC